MTKLIAAVVAASISAILASPSAEARPRRDASTVQQFCGDRYCSSASLIHHAQVRTGHASHRGGASRRYAGRHPSARAGRHFRTARSTTALEANRPVRVASLGGDDPTTYRSAVHERAGNLSIPAVARGRWCGWWMGVRHGLSDRALYVAAAWARVGQRASGPCVGCIGVMRHHVYEVVAVLGRGKVLAISGNDGGAVRTRVRSTSRTFAWRTL